MQTPRPGTPKAGPRPQTQAFAAHRLGLYVAFAALLIDQLIR